MKTVYMRYEALRTDAAGLELPYEASLGAGEYGEIIISGTIVSRPGAVYYRAIATGPDDLVVTLNTPDARLSLVDQIPDATTTEPTE